VLPLPLVDTAVRRAERKAEEQQQHHGANRNGKLPSVSTQDDTVRVLKRDGRIFLSAYNQAV